MTDFNAKHNRAVWFDIPVADLERAATFYRAVLAIEITTESHGDMKFCVLDHKEGNGGCLVPSEGHISADHGILLYLNVNGRIQEAVEEVKKHGGKIKEDIHPIGPYGFRAIVIDSEGNRLALHSTTND